MSPVKYCKATKKHPWLKKGVIIYFSPEKFLYYILIGETVDNGLLYFDPFIIDEWIKSGYIKMCKKSYYYTKTWEPLFIPHTKPNESKESYEKRKKLYTTKTWDFSFISPITVRLLNEEVRYNHSGITSFKYYDVCCLCNGQGCECCDDGIITYYFNSEFTEPNVIGINERYLN